MPLGVLAQTDGSKRTSSPKGDFGLFLLTPQVSGLLVGTTVLGSGAAAGAAGGVLSGTYPNPGFAVPMATTADLAAQRYLHSQATPAVEWIVNHNLGRMPSVELRTVGGAVFEGECVGISNNQLRVYLSLAIAGFAYCV